MKLLRRIGALALDFLRELADENAYHRYLAARRRHPSAAEWRRFTEHRLQTKYTRAKCC